MRDDKLNSIIKLIHDNYPIDVIKDMWDFNNSQIDPEADRTGDSFALAILKEICDVYDDEKSYMINLLEIHRALVIASIDLQAVEKIINIEIEKESSNAN